MLWYPQRNRATTCSAASASATSVFIATAAFRSHRGYQCNPFGDRIKGNLPGTCWSWPSGFWGIVPQHSWRKPTENRRLDLSASREDGMATRRRPTPGSGEMNQAEQAQQAGLFRDQHRRPRLLLLLNAWDAMSARVFVAAGFDAIATTSGGVAWSLGYADGEQAPWDEVVAATARIVRVARVPVTADIEAAYCRTPPAGVRPGAENIGGGAGGGNLQGGTARGPVPIRRAAGSPPPLPPARE